MAKEYYKKSTGLAPTNTPKIRIYESVDDALADLDNLEVGDVVASKLVEGAADVAEAQQIIADAVSEIDKVIPEDAGVTNMLVTQDELDEATGGITDKVDPTASSTNKLLSQNAIYGIMDAIEPIGTIKAVYASSGWDSHWHICDGTEGTPDLQGYTIMGVDANHALGSTSTGLLPNITGSVNLNANINGGSPIGANPTGAFKTSGSSPINLDSGSYGSRPSTLEIDASQVSGLYGTTDKVVPANVRVYFIMKISNYAS